MKILSILPRIPYPARDGGAIVILETLRQLHLAGHHVDVLALNTKKHRQDPAVLAQICTSIHTVDVDTTISALGLIRGLFRSRLPDGFGIDAGTSYWVSRFADELALESFRTHAMLNGPYDLVLCESLFTACYGIAIRPHLHGPHPTPILMRAHNVEHIIQSRLSKERSRSRLERWYRSRTAQHTHTYESYIGTAVDAIATVSDDDATEFRSYHPTALVETVQPGVHLPERYTGAVDFDAICMLGSLDWTPNLEGASWFIQHVFPRIREQRPSTTLHIAGRNPTAQALAFHNGTSIFVHGEIEDALAFRQQRALTVVPLYSGSGIRIKILEALAARSPIVTTPIGCEGVGVVHDKEVLIYDTAGEFADACVRVLNEPELSQRLVVSGFDFVSKRYSWSAATDRLIALGRRVIDRVTNPRTAVD
ncbi:MAG: glycosyltransferase [Ignavibacteria bacterium]|nr:glycosyltransferase [Ignavibacteria bacterium]